MQAFFDLCKRDEIQQAHDFSNQFQVSLSKLPDVAGTSGDYVVMDGNAPKYPTGTVIEFKFDKMSKKSGNIFLEFQQTTTNWFQCKSSGVKLAMECDQVVVVSIPTRFGNGMEHFLIHNMDEYDRVVQESHRTITTRPQINGSPRGCYTRGHLVKISALEQILESFCSRV